MTVINATDETFSADIATGKPVLLDFWAPWCGPCRKISPIVDEIAAEHPEYTVVKVNIDEQAKTTLDFSVMGVPTLVVLDPNGEQVERFTGPKPKAALLASLGKVG